MGTNSFPIYNLCSIITVEKLKLKDYQKEAAKFGLKRSCAFFIDPGMGKTAIALTIARILKKRQKARRILVIAAINIMHETWPAELKKWKQFRKLSCTILHGKDKAENIKLKRDIYLINPEGLKWLFEQDATFDILIVDESSKFKNPSGARLKLLKKQLNSFKYRYIMTGTPAPNSLQDLFSQMYIVDVGKTFGPFVTHFRNRYFNLVNPRFFTYSLKRGAKEAIEKRIAPRAFVLQNTKIEKPVFNYIKVSMPSTIQKKYDSMEKKLFASIDGSRVLAMSSGSAYNKCRQMANGALYKEDATEFHRLHNKKLEVLTELVAELQGKPLLVGYQFKHDLSRLLKAFDKPLHIGGDVKQSDRRRIIRKWNAGNVSLLLGQLGTISHGLNLQESGCADVCFFSLTDDLEAYEQFYRRIYGRHGSQPIVRVHHIVTKNTVDQAILRRLKSKNKTQMSVMEAIDKYRRSKLRNL